MATFKQLQDEVLNQGFGEQGRSRAKDYINEAQARVASRATIRDLLATSSVSTVAGTATVALPADLMRLDSVVATTNGVELSYWPDYVDLATRNGLGQQGFPLAYSLSDKTATLLLNPIPDAAYGLLLTYYQLPATLSADGDTPVIPARYHDLLVSYAASRMSRQMQKFKEAQAYEADFENGLRVLMNDRQYEVSATPRFVRGIW